MKKISNTRAKITEQPFSMRRQKPLSYLSEPNGNSKKLRKSVSDVRTEKSRCSPRLKSKSEGRVRELSSSLTEKNASTKSSKLSQASTTTEKHFSCHIKKKTLECKVCTKTFRHQTNLKKHCKIHLQEKSLTFNKSKTPYKDKNHLERHFLSYSLKKRIDSKKCLNANKLRDYQTKEVKTNPECKPLFRSPHVQAIKQKIQLKNSSVIKKERPFSCSTCKKFFKRNDHLKRHFSTHTGDKPFSCSTCKMLFQRKDHLKRHLSTHTENKPFSCGTCKKMFNRKDHLKKHFSVHTEDKSCSRLIHKKRLTLKSHLKKPLRIHLSDKPFACYKCSKTFKHKNHLKLHNRIHLKKDSFSCKQCEKTFKQEIYLQRHLIIHSRKNVFARNKHKNIFQCKVGVKRRLEGKYKSFDQKLCKKVFKERDETKYFSEVCTRSKSLSSENFGKGFDHKYEVLSTACTDTKSNSYDCSTPRTIQEDNRQLEERHPADLIENSLQGNTNLKQKIENGITMPVNTERSQDSCDNEKSNTSHFELNMMKRRKISAYSEICTRSKTLSSENCGKGLDHKYEVLSSACTDTKSNSYDCSTPRTIQEDNRQLEERHPADLIENSLQGNTNLKQKIENGITMPVNTERSQDSCDNEKSNTSHFELNMMKRRKISAYSEICTRSKTLSSENCGKGLDHKYEVLSSACTNTESNSYDCSTPRTIQEDNRQLEERHPADLIENSLQGNTNLKQKIENGITMPVNTERSKDSCDNEKSNTSHFELNMMKRRKISAYSEICTRLKSLSIKTCENELDYVCELSTTGCTDSKINSFDWSAPCTIREGNRKFEEKVCTDFAKNSLKDNTHLKQKIGNELIHINTDTQSCQDCFDNEKNNSSSIELNQTKGANISAYSIICTRKKSLSSENCGEDFNYKYELYNTACNDSKNNSWDCSFPDTIRKDNRPSEEKNCIDFVESSITGNTNLTQTENQPKVYLDTERENSVDCCDNETKNPNPIGLNQLKLTNISAYSVICTRSKSFSSKNCEKDFYHKDELASTDCTDSKNNSCDYFFPGTIKKDNIKLKGKSCTDLAENSVTGNTHLAQTLENELLIHLNTETDNSLDCCDKETNNPNHIEINQMKGTNVSPYSVIRTRSKSFSSKIWEKDFDHKDELASTTCSVSKYNSFGCSVLDEIRRDIRQVEENICSYLVENSLIDNTHLEQIIQNELMIHINAEKENSQDC